MNKKELKERLESLDVLFTDIMILAGIVACVSFGLLFWEHCVR